jgi:hypothetical protein
VAEHDIETRMPGGDVIHGGELVGPEQQLQHDALLLETGHQRFEAIQVSPVRRAPMDGNANTVRQSAPAVDDRLRRAKPAAGQRRVLQHHSKGDRPVLAE